MSGIMNMRWLWLGLATAAVAVAMVLAVASPDVPARAGGQCAADCNTAHAQCMQSTNDRNTCDVELNMCLQACAGQ